MSQIFKLVFQTGDINICVLLGIFLSRYVQLKSSFSDKKNISGEIRRKCVIFLVSLRSRCAHVILGRKTKATDKSFSLLKIFLFYGDRIEVT